MSNALDYVHTKKETGHQLVKHEPHNGAVRVGPLRITYWSKGIELNLPQLICTSLTTVAVMGVVFYFMGKWQIGDALKKTMGLK